MHFLRKACVALVGDDGKWLGAEGKHKPHMPRQMLTVSQSCCLGLTCLGCASLLETPNPCRHPKSIQLSQGPRQSPCAAEAAACAPTALACPRPLTISAIALASSMLPSRLSSVMAELMHSATRSAWAPRLHTPRKGSTSQWQGRMDAVPVSQPAHLAHHKALSGGGCCACADPEPPHLPSLQCAMLALGHLSCAATLLHGVSPISWHLRT